MNGSRWLRLNGRRLCWCGSCARSRETDAANSRWSLLLVLCVIGAPTWLRSTQFFVNPSLEGSERAQPLVKRGINKPDTNDRQEHGQRRAKERGGHFGTHLISPLSR